MSTITAGRVLVDGYVCEYNGVLVLSKDWLGFGDWAAHYWKIGGSVELGCGGSKGAKGRFDPIPTGNIVLAGKGP